MIIYNVGNSVDMENISRYIHEYLKDVKKPAPDILVSYKPSPPMNTAETFMCFYENVQKMYDNDLIFNARLRSLFNEVHKVHVIDMSSRHVVIGNDDHDKFHYSWITLYKNMTIVYNPLIIIKHLEDNTTMCKDAINIILQYYN